MRFPSSFPCTYLFAFIISEGWHDCIAETHEVIEEILHSAPVFDALLRTFVRELAEGDDRSGHGRDLEQEASRPRELVLPGHVTGAYAVYRMRQW